MRKQKRLLAVVIALAMMVSIGAGSGITAQAAECPPHGSFQERHVASSNPMSSSHTLQEYDEDINEYVPTETCSFIYQYHTMAVYCPKCGYVQSTYQYCSEMHGNPKCPEY